MALVIPTYLDRGESSDELLVEELGALGDRVTLTGKHKHSVTIAAGPAAVTVGDTIAGESLHPIGDKEVFTFEGTAGEELNVFFQGTGTSARRSCGSSTAIGTADEAKVGNTVQSDQGDATLSGQSTGVFQLPATGTYQIVVDSEYCAWANRGDDGPYRFHVAPQ